MKNNPPQHTDRHQDDHEKADTAQEVGDRAVATIAHHVLSIGQPQERDGHQRVAQHGQCHAGILGRRSLMSDPIHPNNDGYAIMAERFKEAIAPFL